MVGAEHIDDALTRPRQVADSGDPAAGNGKIAHRFAVVV
jgi:hypothetical protein